LLSMCQERHGIFSMVRGYHVHKSIWTVAVGEEFELTLGKEPVQTLLAPAAALATACGRSKVACAKKFACLNFRSFYFRIRDGIYKIKLAPYENIPLYSISMIS
jgi:hypothetical protein